MSADAWMTSYLAGEMALGCTGLKPGAGTATVGQSPTADPLLIVGTVLETLAARGVSVVVDHSLECAVEAAGRLLRCLGVEALDSLAVTPWMS